MIDPTSFRFSRRHVLKLSAAGWLISQSGGAAALAAGDNAAGLVLGEAEGAAAGRQILAAGGNAVDAAVSAALVAGVVAVPNCGIGGYGGHMVIGWPDGRTAAIDFNSAAPAAAHEAMYPLDARGRVRGQVNTFGWLAAGVPGTLAGLQLALDRFGTRSLATLLEPAIRHAREGFPVNRGLAQAIRRAEAQLSRDPGSVKLFFVDGRPLAEGDTFRNVDLAAMLDKLARDNTVEDFYRGQTARQIAAAFKPHGGLVTAADLAAYQARQVEPHALEWCGRTIYTPPLTAGGMSVLQTLATLKALDWQKSDPDDPRSVQARIEAVRLAWHDRLTLLGDPAGSQMPVARLLSAEYAGEAAARVRKALDAHRLIPLVTDGRPATGTIHLSAADSGGMMVALTLTHGGGFGARITVDGLGLILGHGMSRFNPTPGHPNAPRAGKRPLNNMCPTIVFADSRPIAVMGASGGRRIPNTMCDVLVRYVGREMSLPQAAAAPRLHTEGDAVLGLAKGWSPQTADYLKRAGYQVQPGAGANFNGIVRDPKSGAFTQVP